MSVRVGLLEYSCVMIFVFVGEYEPKIIALGTIPPDAGVPSVRLAGWQQMRPMEPPADKVSPQVE